MRASTWVALGLAGLAPAVVAWAQLPPAGFAEAQVAEGKAIYAAKCALCHGDTLTGGDHGPPLSGDGFWKTWSGQPARKLYSRIISTMPYDDPGSLSEADTLAITALIARTNGAPEGPVHAAAAELDAAALTPTN